LKQAFLSACTVKLETPTRNAFVENRSPGSYSYLASSSDGCKATLLSRGLFHLDLKLSTD